MNPASIVQHRFRRSRSGTLEGDGNGDRDRQPDRPDIRGGRPCIAGTGVSIRRIARWHQMGLVAEEIVRKFGHLSLAQVHAALAYYQANQGEINADLEAEAREAEALERQDRRCRQR
ncbi:MAG: DUF433 domain-containing protein [Bryobacteraceae bacterium]